jgi:hypothetical protein
MKKEMKAGIGVAQPAMAKAYPWRIRRGNTAMSAWRQSASGAESMAAA